MINLSYSKLQCYETCPKMYKLRYIDYWEPINKRSPLLMGSCIDEAMNILLLTKKKVLTDKEKVLAEKDVYQAYEEEFQKLRNEPNIVFFKSDYETEHIPRDILEGLKSDSRELAETSLYYLGLELIKAFERDILPQIDEVLEIQCRVVIENERGDKIKGLIDFKAIFKDQPGIIYIVDTKTTKNPYVERSASESDQLATYSEAEQIENIAYATLVKKRYKKEPYYRTQLIRDVASEELKQKVFDNYEKLLDNIMDEKFEPNFKSCKFQFGMKCDFYNLCHNDSKRGLRKIEWNEKKKTTSEEVK